MKLLVSRGPVVMLAAALTFTCGDLVAQNQDKVVPATNLERSELDVPISLLQEAKRNYGAVKDYTCTLVSEERVKGKMQDKNIIQMKFKEAPFSVYMRWIAPKASVGQEVAFVEGKNNNKMRVKSTLIINKVVGFVSIDITDPRVMEHSRHTIREAGMGNMIDQNLRQWELARKKGKTGATITEAKYNERDCICIEVASREKGNGSYCHRSVIYLEKSSKLPIRLENYDWPREGGAKGGDLLESFSYVNLQFNLGLRDDEFAK